MQKAQQEMTKPSGGGQAAGKQAEARQEMEKAAKKLDELARRPLTEEEKKKAEQLARRQAENREITRELEKLLEQMQREAAQRSAQSAGDNMQQARKSLDQGEPKDAGEDEEKALEDLKQAERDLEDALAEIKRQAEEELLIQLETELRNAIQAEEAILASTREIDTSRAKKGALDREEVLKTRGLGRTQEDLSKRMGEILKKLSEEDVQVFRYVVESVIDDMNESSAALKEAETGAQPQGFQADAIRKLKDLVEAFDIQRRKSKSMQGGGGGGAGGGGKKPLVQEIVQINMIKRLQEELLRKTREFQKGGVKGADDFSPVEKAILKRLSDEQGKLGDLVRKFADKLERMKKQMEAQGPREE